MDHRHATPIGSALVCLTILIAPAVGAHDGSHERIERLTDQIAAAPSLATPYAERAAAYRDDQRFDEAIDDYQRAIHLDPRATDVSVRLAETLFDAGRLDEASAIVAPLLREQPDHPTARLVRAHILVATGAPEAAARDFGFVVATLPRPSPDLILQYANAYVAAGDLDTAIAVLDQGSERLGRLSVFEDRCITLEAALGRFEGALARLDRMFSEAPRADRWLFRRGELLDAAGRSEEAELAYREALDFLLKLPKRLRDVPASRALAASLRRRLDVDRE